MPSPGWSRSFASQKRYEAPYRLNRNGHQGHKGTARVLLMDFLNDLLRRPPANWRDLVDILVVSVLIYEVLKLIRGTRAVQMALGAAVFVGLFYFSVWGHLETVNW